ncbi:MAG: amidohydrolase family protein [Hymenobacteraceae bacterium]|nr:amidohydrolase family protein [Hymenobacteraceae bacterium]
MFLILMMAVASCKSKQKADYIIQDVKLFDGVHVWEKVDVIIDGGRIVDISSGAGKYNAREVIAAKGYTIIPPLIDSHVHIRSLSQLKESLNSGVFAVIDLHSPPGLAKQLKAQADSLHHATLLSSGPALTVAGGHGTQFGYWVPTVNKEREHYEFVKDRAIEGADLVKIVREPLMPTLDFETIAALIKASHQFGKIAVGHISTVSDATKLGELGINGLSHIWFDRKATEAELALFQKKQPFVIPTLVVTGELLSISNKRGWANHYLSFQELQKEVNRLHGAGVTLLAGTDAPNLGLKFGSSLIQEVMLMVSSGLSETEALKTATTNPVQVFGLDENLLPVKGHKANFLLVEGDPINDITALQKIKEIWVRGSRVKK